MNSFKPPAAIKGLAARPAAARVSMMRASEAWLSVAQKVRSSPVGPGSVRWIIRTRGRPWRSSGRAATMRSAGSASSRPHQALPGVRSSRARDPSRTAARACSGSAAKRAVRPKRSAASAWLVAPQTTSGAPVAASIRPRTARTPAVAADGRSFSRSLRAMASASGEGTGPAVIRRRTASATARSSASRSVSACGSSRGLAGIRTAAVPGPEGRAPARCDRRGTG